MNVEEWRQTLKRIKEENRNAKIKTMEVRKDLIKATRYYEQLCVAKDDVEEKTHFLLHMKVDMEEELLQIRNWEENNFALFDNFIFSGKNIQEMDVKKLYKKFDEFISSTRTMETNFKTLSCYALWIGTGKYPSWKCKIDDVNLKKKNKNIESNDRQVDLSKVEYNNEEKCFMSNYFKFVDYFLSSNDEVSVISLARKKKVKNKVDADKIQNLYIKNRLELLLSDKNSVINPTSDNLSIQNIGSFKIKRFINCKQHKSCALALPPAATKPFKENILLTRCESNYTFLRRARQLLHTKIIEKLPRDAVIKLNQIISKLEVYEADNRIIRKPCNSVLEASPEELECQVKKPLLLPKSLWITFILTIHHSYFLLISKLLNIPGKSNSKNCQKIQKFTCCTLTQDTKCNCMSTYNMGKIFINTTFNDDESCIKNDQCHNGRATNMPASSSQTADAEDNSEGNKKILRLQLENVRVLYNDFKTSFLAMMKRETDVISSTPPIPDKKNGPCSSDSASTENNLKK